MKKFLFIIIAFVAVSTQAQTIEQILDKVQQHVLENNFKVNLKYQLFKGVKGVKELEMYDGVYIKKGNDFYNKIHHTETIITGNTLLKINHDQKAILYSTFNTKDAKKTNMLDLKVLLSNFEHPKVTDLGNAWQISMIAVEYSQMPYSKIIMDINKKNYTLTKQVLYLTSLINFSAEEDETDINIPRIEITYSEYLKLSNRDKAIFNKTNYIIINKTKVLPSKTLSNYDIIQN